MALRSFRTLRDEKQEQILDGPHRISASFAMRLTSHGTRTTLRRARAPQRAALQRWGRTGRIENRKQTNQEIILSNAFKALAAYFELVLCALTHTRF